MEQYTRHETEKEYSVSQNVLDPPSDRVPDSPRYTLYSVTLQRSRQVTFIAYFNLLRTLRISCSLVSISLPQSRQQTANAESDGLLELTTVSPQDDMMLTQEPRRRPDQFRCRRFRG